MIAVHCTVCGLRYVGKIACTHNEMWLIRLPDPMELDLDEWCIECRQAEFTVIDGTIKDLGKFQGEALDTYHAYHIMRDGFADDSMIADGLEIVRCGNSFIEFLDVGFITGTHYASTSEADAEWEKLQDEYSVYPDDDFDGDDQDRFERDKELLQDAGE